MNTVCDVLHLNDDRPGDHGQPGHGFDFYLAIVRYQENHGKAKAAGVILILSLTECLLVYMNMDANPTCQIPLKV